MTDYSPSDVAEITEITAVADVAGSLGDKYFHLYSANNANIFTIWFNVDSTNNDPNILDTTAVEIVISANDSADTVASAMQTALDALSDFGVIVSSPDAAMIIVTNADDGSAITAHDPSIRSLDKAINGTGFAFVVTVNGELDPTIPSGITFVQIVGRINNQTAFQQGGEFKESHFATRAIDIIVNERSIIEIFED
jgi:hypothetical protein